MLLPGLELIGAATPVYVPKIVVAKAQLRIGLEGRGMWYRVKLGLESRLNSTQGCARLRGELATQPSRMLPLATFGPGSELI